MKKFKQEHKLPRIEFIKYQLDRAINHTYTILNKTDLTILAYVYVYGVKCKEKLYEDRILTNHNSIANYISKLTNSGFLVKTPATEADHRGNKGYSDIYLNPNLQITEEDFAEITIVKIDNTSDEVYHPHFRA